MNKHSGNRLQNTSTNKLITVSRDSDSLKDWIEVYFRFEVTTSERSQKEQARDLNYFAKFFELETRGDKIGDWTPRLSQSFKTMLQNTLTNDKKRRWNDRTINRIIAHLKTFAKWVHKFKPFPLGEPTAKLKSIATTSLLEIERALTKSERRKLLDSADILVEIGGRSKDRHRYRSVESRPRRKGYRPYRNRAIVYTLIETGMRRTAITKIDLEDINIEKGTVSALEKGSFTHVYQISREGLEAIKDYLERERREDAKDFKSPALFLPANTQKKNSRNGRLSSKTIENIWKEACKVAEVKGKSPHSARHAMGKHIIEKTGNISAVQRQLGHKNTVYSMQYGRITAEELSNVLNDR